LNSNKKFFDIKPILDSLRSRIDDSEFGYRMQALFAHVLLEMGGSIVQINQQGHPDIKSEIYDKTSLFQVKSITHSHASWALMIDPDDIAGIRPSIPSEVGYFAVLDCAAPVSWVVCEYGSIQRHQGRSVNIETIRASANIKMSNECTLVFAEMIMQKKEKLHLLTYSILCERALRGERL
jgi:hypothetical protein